MSEIVTEAWNEYQRGVDYKTQIDLYDTIDENYSFYIGDQWRGINATNLPTPVYNIIKQACKFMITQVKDRKLTPNFTAEGVYDEETQQDIVAVVNQLSEYSKMTWDRLRMEYKNLEGLKDAFISGDYILYHWWNDKIETGQPHKGDIDNMIIDNVNYYPSNPNCAEVQKQGSIILVVRDTVENVKTEAKENGMGKAELDLIVPDEDNEYTAGDDGKTEIDRAEKCNKLIRMWKQDGVIWFAKYTKAAVVQKPKASKLRLYPIAMMNWESRKNCCHGVAEVTYLKTNQVAVNKLMAFTLLYLLQTAYPKVLYDKSVIKEWTNRVAGAIAVNGNVEYVAKYMQPPQIPFDVWKGFESTIQMTKDLMGANDAALGLINDPDNTSAFIAVREASITPLRANEQRFHQMMHDMCMIWADFWLAYYPESRMIPIDVDGQKMYVPFEAKRYKDLIYDVKIDIGESTKWSEVTTVQTLDKLLQQGVITASEFIEMLPDGYIPNKTKMFEKIKAREEMQMAQAQEGEMPEESQIETPQI